MIAKCDHKQEKDIYKTWDLMLCQNENPLNFRYRYKMYVN